MIRFASFLFPALALLFGASSCSSAPSQQPVEPLKNAPPPGFNDEPVPGTAEYGEALFIDNCAVCHGPNGKLGYNGAHDLTKSNLNATGRVYMVTQGLGKMPSFKNQLTTEQIQQVVEYSLTLK